MEMRIARLGLEIAKSGIPEPGALVRSRIPNPNPHAGWLVLNPKPWTLRLSLDPGPLRWLFLNSKP